MRSGWADNTADTPPQICAAVGKAAGWDPAPFRNLHTAEGNWFALDPGPQPLMSASPNPGRTAQRGCLTGPTLDRSSGPSACWFFSHALRSPSVHTSYLCHRPSGCEEPGPQGAASSQSEHPPSIPSVSGPEEGHCDARCFPYTSKCWPWICPHDVVC